MIEAKRQSWLLQNGCGGDVDLYSSTMRTLDPTSCMIAERLDRVIITNAPRNNTRFHEESFVSVRVIRGSLNLASHLEAPLAKPDHHSKPRGFPGGFPRHPKMFRTLSINPLSSRSLVSTLDSSSSMRRCSRVNVVGVTTVTATKRSPFPRPPRTGIP